MKRAHITVVGSNMVDLITYVTRMPVRGETIEAPEFSMGFGGKGANQAVAAAKLGADVQMVTKVGDDLFGPNTLENFKRNGIGTEYVTVEPGSSSGVAPIFVEPDSSNSILIVKGANAALSPEDIDKAIPVIRKSDLVVLQLEIRMECVIHTVELCRELSVPVLLNPAPASPDLPLNAVSGVDFFVPNETELQLVTGTDVETVDEFAEAARSLVSRGMRNVIVTLGARGVLVVTGEGVKHIPAHPVDSIDSTGAGDAFIGCFAAIYGETGEMEHAVRAANRYAAISTTRRGTQTSLGGRDDIAPVP